MSIKIPPQTSREGILKILDDKGYMVNHIRKSIQRRYGTEKKPNVTLKQADTILKKPEKTQSQIKMVVEKKKAKEEKQRVEKAKEIKLAKKEGVKEFKAGQKKGIKDSGLNNTKTKSEMKPKQPKPTNTTKALKKVKFDPKNVKVVGVKQKPITIGAKPKGGRIETGTLNKGKVVSGAKNKVKVGGGSEAEKKLKKLKYAPLSELRSDIAELETEIAEKEKDIVSSMKRKDKSEIKENIMKLKDLQRERDILRVELSSRGGGGGAVKKEEKKVAPKKKVVTKKKVVKPQEKDYGKLIDDKVWDTIKDLDWKGVVLSKIYTVLTDQRFIVKDTKIDKGKFLVNYTWSKMGAEWRYDEEDERKNAMTEILTSKFTIPTGKDAKKEDKKSPFTDDEVKLINDLLHGSAKFEEGDFTFSGKKVPKNLKSILEDKNPISAKGVQRKNFIKVLKVFIKENEPNSSDDQAIVGLDGADRTYPKEMRKLGLRLLEMKNWV